MEFRALVDFASDAAFAITGMSRIVAWNERATSFLGYQSTEALDRRCYEILQAVLPDGRPVCGPKCKGTRCFERGLPFSVTDCCLRHKDGRWLHAEINTMVSSSADRGRTAPCAAAIVLLRPRDESAFLAPADGRLQVFTFGRLGLCVNGRAIPMNRWHRRHALTLLKILVTYRREALHREQLIAHLWPNAEERRGRERLKVTTHYLREKLRVAGSSGDIIAATGSAYVLTHDAVWLDCEAFEGLYGQGRRLAQRGQLKEALTCFESAARLYQGDYLPEDRYADWCAEERERLRESYLDVLDHIVGGYLDRGDFEEAAVVCRQGLVHEPCREGFHRALMICLARLGQRDRAIAQYDHCRQALKAELGVGPASETERLYRELVLTGGIAGAKPTLPR